MKTDGGRYTVRINARARIPSYWDLAPNQVVRGSWYIRHEDTLRPFPEDHAAIIEGDYQKALLAGVWPRRVALPNGDLVTLLSQVVHVLDF